MIFNNQNFIFFFKLIIVKFLLIIIIQFKFLISFIKKEYGAKTSLTPKTYIYLKGDTKKIKVKLLNAFGYAPGKGQIINFKVDGKKYSTRTNNNGNAKSNCKPLIQVLIL